MSHVDIYCRYTRFPTKPSAAFPDKTETWQPVLEIGFQGKTKAAWTVALLDSGSLWTIFGTQWADVLGVDWKSCPSFTYSGIGSVSNVGYVADVKLILKEARYSWPARVVFSEALNAHIALLGHDGFCEHFEVRFKTGQRDFRVHLK